MAYNAADIEAKWQQYWDDNQCFRTEDDFSKPKYYVLDMFPYPSGKGLHVGHPEGYTATDIVARYKRLTGFNVLHPMGFDAFGLATERYAMENKIHPSKVTQTNIETFTRQLKMLGFSFDWSRQVNTTTPEYYKWTQWIFRLIYDSWFDADQQKARPISELEIPDGMTDPLQIQAYQDAHRLAFIAEIPVNYCPELGTVLANEEVDEWKGKGYTVERRPMRQWMLRITAYAERLLQDLELVDWPDSTREMQKNWIGKSEGASISFAIDGHETSVDVFTTRPDTLFGSTYLVLAPEHPLTEVITTEEHREAVSSYVRSAALKSDLERQELSKEKTGQFTGAYAVNPATGAKIPVWTADYVLAHYGTGAIMAVPGHDTRDHEFATQFGLPIVRVVEGGEEDITKEAYTGPGVACNSVGNGMSLNGLETEAAISAMITWLEQQGIGKGKVQYKLRDWLFSRQRYWGEPVPVLFFEDGTRRLMGEHELPLVLPEVDDFMPADTGESPLAKVEDWIQFTDPVTGKPARIETNTMPQWAGSCWYYLRYIDPHNSENLVDPEKERYWMQNGGVDLYIGGAEHAVLHLLYARFWHKVLFDYGVVSTPEPFRKLYHQGMILGEDKRKMSKSLGNVVNPDIVVSEFGADSLRVFEMFMGPLDMTKPWSTKGVEGVARFLNRSWNMILDDNNTLQQSIVDRELTEEEAFLVHTTIKKISQDIESLGFNTAVSQLMIFVNHFLKADERPRAAMEAFVLCLAPFAPHIAEELWQHFSDSDLANASFPEWDESKLVKSTIEIVVQVNNKVRGRVNVPQEAGEDAVMSAAMDVESFASQVEGKTIRKTIYVPGKLLNVIAN